MASKKSHTLEHVRLHRISQSGVSSRWRKYITSDLLRLLLLSILNAHGNYVDVFSSYFSMHAFWRIGVHCLLTSFGILLLYTRLLIHCFPPSGQNGHAHTRTTRPIMLDSVWFSRGPLFLSAFGFGLGFIPLLHVFLNTPRLSRTTSDELNGVGNW